MKNFMTMRETRKQTIDRLIRQNASRLTGYSTTRSGAIYEYVLRNFAPGCDFVALWKRGYNAVISAEKYQQKKRKETKYIER